MQNNNLNLWVEMRPCGRSDESARVLSSFPTWPARKCQRSQFYSATPRTHISVEAKILPSHERPRHCRRLGSQGNPLLNKYIFIFMYLFFECVNPLLNCWLRRPYSTHEVVDQGFVLWSIEPLPSYKKCLF
jgi:hypothetical protein